MNTTQRAEYLAHTYADAILRLSYTYLKNTQDAQDICQTVFVRLLTEQREFESPAHERAYILYYYEGYQAAEIGQIRGVPTATVHTRLARGRAKLKTMLGGMEYEQSV